MRSTPERLWPGVAANEARGACPKQRERVLVAGHSGDKLGGVVEEIAKPHAAPRDSEDLAAEHTSVVRSVEEAFVACVDESVGGERREERRRGVGGGEEIEQSRAEETWAGA